MYLFIVAMIFQVLHLMVVVLFYKDIYENIVVDMEVDMDMDMEVEVGDYFLQPH
jgi:hypothetical protein